MHRELNSKEEMYKRLAYALYVLLLSAACIVFLHGVLTERASEALLGILFASAAFFLRKYGKQMLEFERLYRIFPMGEEKPLSTHRTCQTIETLIQAFHRSDNWVDRQSIRNQLELLIQKDPQYLEPYADELRKVHPGVFHSQQKKIRD